jgi:Flp pilus assembly protein TadB
MDSPETRKQHRQKQRLQSLQEERDNILVPRPESASQLKEAEAVSNASFNGEVKSKVQGLGVQRALPAVSSAPFSATEELVWDWQAVALALAVFACLLFFVVACVYTVHHARQWRRLKDNFQDFEAGQSTIIFSSIINAWTASVV